MLTFAIILEEEIPDAFNHVKSIFHDNAHEFIQCYEDNYAFRKLRRVVWNTEFKNDPLFNQSLWSVYENIDFVKWLISLIIK